MKQGNRAVVHAATRRASLQEFKAELFRALAHPTRIRILEVLRTGEKNVTELQQELEIEAASVSQQLGVLRAQGLVAADRRGTSVFYRMRGSEVMKLLDVARAIFDRQLAELQALGDDDQKR